VASQLNVCHRDSQAESSTDGVVMSGIFYTQQLTQGSSPTTGPRSQTVEAYFPELQVFATISLSTYRTVDFPSGTANFWNAEAYIGHPPVTGSPRANTVYVRTGHLTFTLEVTNATASAVFSIYDYAQAVRSEMAEPEHRLDLAIYDEAGNVVGTHRVVQLPGGAKIYEDAVREQVLAEARARIEDRTLDVTAIDPEAIPDRQDFRIDPSTRKPLPLA
jgi:hypothetical protein